MNMNYYRISKYNPQNIKNGKYVMDEWTDFSDIGEMFCGKILTEEEYLWTENNYILCIENIIENSGLRGFYIKGYEEYWEKCLWQNNQYVDKNSIAEIMSDCLRNKCWCKLINGDNYIHFGYDYYMYVGSFLPLKKMSEICGKYNLFCEIKKSPYI